MKVRSVSAKPAGTDTKLVKMLQNRGRRVMIDLFARPMEKWCWMPLGDHRVVMIATMVIFHSAEVDSEQGKLLTLHDRTALEDARSDGSDRHIGVQSIRKD